MKQETKHIFFDLDLTLWDFENNSREAIARILDERALMGKNGITLDSFLSVYLPINDRMWEDYNMERIDKETLRVGRFEQTLARFSIKDPQTVNQVTDDYIHISPHGKHLYPYALEILQYLSPKYPIHIITNGFNDTQRLKLDNTGISPYITHLITSENAGAKKPNRQIFEYACDMAEIEPGQCVIIGDDFRADIEGGLAAGFDVIYYNAKCRSFDDHGGKVREIRSHKELFELY